MKTEQVMEEDALYAQGLRDAIMRVAEVHEGYSVNGLVEVDASNIWTSNEYLVVCLSHTTREADVGVFRWGPMEPRRQLLKKPSKSPSPPATGGLFASFAPSIGSTLDALFAIPRPDLVVQLHARSSHSLVRIVASVEDQVILTAPPLLTECAHAGVSFAVDVNLLRRALRALDSEEGVRRHVRIYIENKTQNLVFVTARGWARVAPLKWLQ